MYVLLFLLKPTNPKDDVGDYRSLVSSLKLSDGAVRSGEELSKVKIFCSNLIYFFIFVSQVPIFFLYLLKFPIYTPFFLNSPFHTYFCTTFQFPYHCRNLERCLRYFSLILIIGRGWPGPARCLKDWRSRWEACSIDEQLNNLLMFNRTIGSDFWKAKCTLTRTWWIADWRDGQSPSLLTLLTTSWPENEHSLTIRQWAVPWYWYQYLTNSRFN